ncbi:hypothetical protein IGI04_008334 [Brassica rapa subsp. trilocularis]|uniref:Uncharacterized protein n=1 Tax=Brassica rapa subsp. trilocularis TaxID=1813537 RepID=A0ABQ7NPL6_BRACM|nr:hypothetical protein IGI04_008334 [Brassica rapa subsp. trilocularis]
MFTDLQEYLERSFMNRVFNVTRSNLSFWFDDASCSPVSIRFRDETVFVEVAETIHPIPTESFRFSNSDQLMLLHNTNTESQVSLSLTAPRTVCFSNNCSGGGYAVVRNLEPALADDQIRLGGWRLGL